MPSAIFPRSVDQSPATDERPVDDQSAPDHILFGDRSEVAAVAAVVAVVAQGKVGPARHGVFGLRRTEDGKRATAGTCVRIPLVTVLRGHDAAENRE